MHDDATVRTHGLGPFVTWVSTAVDGEHSVQTSRRHRKRLVPLRLPAGLPSPAAAEALIARDWLRLWAPARLGWWIAVLFMIGSALFALGGLCALWPDVPGLRRIGAGAINPIFFTGSLFFTSAAYLQVFEALNGDITRADTAMRFVGWRPRNLGYLSAAVQFVGTLLFNLDCGDALLAGPAWQMQDAVVWAPDVLGCVCFLIASQLAIMEYAHGWFVFRPRQLSWWIVMINMAGSILFMISGVASFVSPNGELLAPLPTDAGTFGGALCFLVGAYLLIPEQAETGASANG